MRHCGAACLVGGAYFLAAYLSLHLTQGMSGIATIWPASGVLVSALLLARRGQTAVFLCAAGVASLAANILFGSSVSVAAVFTIANLAEGLLISQLVIRTSGAPRMLDDTRWLASFFGATIAGGAISGAVATIGGGGLGMSFFVSWFMTVCLGTLIVTPLIMTIANAVRAGGPGYTRAQAISLVILAVGIAAISGLVFALDDGRFLFLPVIGVVAATYFFGASGAALSISLIAIAVMLQTNFAGTTIGTLNLSEEILFLQFYLLSLLFAAWPLSALMAEKRTLIAQYAETNTYLKLAESTAKVGHWYLGPDNTSLVWSEEVYRIHGLDPDRIEFDDSLDLEEPTSLEHYHADDRERVRGLLLDAMKNRTGFEYRARIVQPSGATLHISSIGHPRYDENGAFEGLFGTFQDVTEQTETFEALQDARRIALSKAKTAQRLAETDELTGIPNRRKALATLDAAAQFAHGSDEPLSLAIFDIDHFKSINDCFGHTFGDEVLKRLTTIVSGQLAPEDLVGRLGGEEFLVILPGKNSEEGYKAIERLRLRIAAENWTAAGLTNVTVSAGIATLESNEKVEEAMQRADAALYAAKQDGRNLLRAAA